MSTDIQLDTLEAKGLIRLASLRPELEYLFRHALVQDAAYGSLLKQERRELHGQVGEALEALYPDRRGELAPVLAMHFEQAGNVERAIDYLVEGAQHALQQNAIHESFNGFDRAATLATSQVDDAVPDGAEAERRRRRLVEIALGRASAGYSFRSQEDAFEELERVVAEAEAIGDPELIARLHMAIALGRLQNGESSTSPLVKRSLDRIAVLAEETGDPSLRAMPMIFIGLGEIFTGTVRKGVAALEEALPLVETRQDSIGAAFARGGLAMGYATLGDFDKADAAAKAATAIARDGDLIARLDALIAESFVHSMRGDLDRAVPLALDCIQQAEQTGASACAVVSSWILGDAFHRQGRFADARDVLQRGEDISFVVDRKVWRPTLQAWLGTAAAVLGDAGEGHWDEALAQARAIDNHQGEAGILFKRGEALAAGGDIDAAVADFEASAAIYGAEGARPILARVLRAWGNALRVAGRTADAEPVFQRSIALFEELGLDREAAAVRTAMALGTTSLTFA
jgi:tetratricopeptide (TPR) repeat protein